MNKIKESLQDMWVFLKPANVHIMGVPEGKEDRERQLSESFQVVPL
jgi:hypothetical protein